MRSPKIRYIIYDEKCMKFLGKNNKEDYYIENGKVIFTEKYHLKRGKCCNNGCKHCPYKKDPKNDKK